MLFSKKILASAMLAGLCAASAPTFAAAIHDSALFTGNNIGRDDDHSSNDAVTLGFSALLGGSTYTGAFVNNNGNITFGQALSTYTPEGIPGVGFPIIAPFWADVDTRHADSGVTSYGTAELNGHKVFGVNWIGVGYYNSQVNKLNSFQLILTERSDVGAGDFDIQFNYDQVQWETGSATSSGGTDGLGGVAAAVGYSLGAGKYFEFAGSRTPGSFLDGNAGGLTNNSMGSNVLGQYNFVVRNGVVSNIPEPSSYALLLAGIALVGVAARKRGSKA
jgi:hypothetical protein